MAHLNLCEHVVHGWLCRLVQRQEKGFDVAASLNLMILMVFWPQSSLIILKPGQRLSGYRLCFLHYMWHQDKKKLQLKSTLCPFDTSVNVHIYLLYKGGIGDPHFDLFAILFLCLPENCFFPRIPVVVFGRFKGWKRGEEKLIGLSTAETASRAKLSSHLD